MTFEEFAEKHGITILNAHPIPKRSELADHWPSEAHHFHVTLAVRSGFSLRVLWSGEYSLGAGHVATWAKSGFLLPPHARKESKAGRPVATRDSRAYSLWQRMHAKPDHMGHGLSLADAEIWELVKARFDTVAPLDVADILESLALDSLGSDESFAHWCENMGFDDDSRKAHRVYNACRDIAGNLRSTLGLTAYAELLEVDGEEMEDIAETESMLRARFAEEVEPFVIAQYGEDDTIALDTAFNDWTDGLCKDGEISNEAYDQVTRADD